MKFSLLGKRDRGDDDDGGLEAEVRARSAGGRDVSEDTLSDLAVSNLLMSL